MIQKSFFAAIIFVMICCLPKKQLDVAKIIIHSAPPNSIITITLKQYLDDIDLAKMELDSTGSGILDIELQKPTIVLMQIDKKYSELYLAPGYELAVTPYTDKPDKPMRYSGIGSDINNYIASLSSLVEKIKWKNGEFIARLDVKDFFIRFDSVKNCVTKFHSQFLDSIKLSKDLSQMLIKKNELELLLIRQQYLFFLQSEALNAENNAIENASSLKQSELPIELKEVMNEVPFDTTLLNIGFDEYSMLLHYYLNNKIYNPNYDLKNWKKKQQYVFPITTNDLIAKSYYPNGIEEYLRAKNIQYWVKLQGITPAIDSVIHNFKTDFKSSRYLSAIQKNYDEWLAISTGKIAPDFNGTTIENENISLKDLKGKVIYIDVWSTWCAPCIEEIPFAKKLQGRFEGNNEVQFVNISIDRDKEAWKNFLLSDKSWKGLHLHLQKKEKDMFWKNYKMFGVPTYMLIDQTGRIINAKALRPAEEGIELQLRNLLSKKV